MSSSLVASLPSPSPLSFSSPPASSPDTAFLPSQPMPSLAPSAPLVLKVRCVSTGDCRRFPLPLSPPLSFAALLSCVSSLFALPHSGFELQWRDEEADMVTVASEDEWQRLQHDARDKQQRVLQLSVVELSQQQQQQATRKSSAGNAVTAVPAVAVPTWQLHPHSAVDLHSSRPSSSLYPSFSASSQEQEVLRGEIEQKSMAFVDETPPPPQQQQQQSKLARQSASAHQSSSPVSSDEESPVLIDGHNLPSASDSHTASALWKRHKYKAQQAQNQRRHSQTASTVPTAQPVAPSLTLGNKRAARPQQLTAPSSTSMPSSPLSRSPPSSAQPSPTALPSGLSQHFERARTQLRSLLPTARSSSSSPAVDGGRPVSKVSAAIAMERENNERIAAAYELLSSFITMDGAEVADDGVVTRDELLSRCIALFVYNERYLIDVKRRNDELAAQLGGIEFNRRAEEMEEADKRRQLLSEAQRHGLRSLSSSVPISSSCSPALVTVMAIIHRHLQSRVVTDVPSTLELFAAALADLTAQVQREENREAELRQVQQGVEEDEKSTLDAPPSSSARVAGNSGDAELLSSLSRLPAPLRDSVRALLTDCVQYAESEARVNPDLSFASISSHSFATTLQAFRTDYQDVLSDELIRQQTERLAQRAASTLSLVHSQQDESKDSLVRVLDAHPPQRREASAEPQLFDVSRSDAMLSDKKILKAVAKAIKKEQKEQRKADHRRRKAGKSKSMAGAAMQQQMDDEEDDEEEELHDLIDQMNNVKRPQQQQQQALGRLPSNESLAAPSVICCGPLCGASCQCHSAVSPVVDAQGRPLHPQPVASPVSPADPTSPFAFQPFPYNLSCKQRQEQQQQQQQQQADSVLQPNKAVVAVPVPHLAVAAVPMHGMPQQPSPPSDPRHFPSLQHSPVFAHPAPVPLTAQPVALPHPAPASAPAPSFASVVSSNLAPASAAAASAASVQSRRLQGLLDSLHVMGFTDDSLNTWLLQRNGYDLNQTVEWLIVQSEVGLD